jgi:tetratricopeptide (TPR) repeat protein
MLQLEGSWILSISRDGLTIALPRGAEGGLVFEASDPTRFRRLQPLRSCDNIALSPDGRWAVTGSFHVPEGMHLWDARTGRLVHDFPGVPDGVFYVRSFSPDGRWLAVGWDGWVLFETTTWTPQVRLIRGVTSGLAFAPDSLTAIYDDGNGTLILAEVETGRELARIEDPEKARMEAAAITPDGSQLVTTLKDRPYLRVWDLRAIRRRLAELRLDWNPPATFDIPEAPRSFPRFPKPFRVERGRLDSWMTEEAAQIVEQTTRAIETNPDDADAHHQRGHALYRLKRFDDAIADFTAALKASPNDAHLLVSRGSAAARLSRLDEAIADCEAALRLKLNGDDRESLVTLCNSLAWTLATGPASVRNRARALNLAWHAVELTPDQAASLRSLGVAQYRTGQYAEATVNLEMSLAAGKGESDASALFFLAMGHHRLGHLDQARDCFDRAVRWLGNQQGLSEQYVRELAAFRAEAQALLDSPPPELPADVFALESPDQP